MQDAIARVRAYQHAYNAPDPPSKRADQRVLATRRRSEASINRWLVRRPDWLYQTTDGRYLGLSTSGLRSNHDGPFINIVYPSETNPSDYPDVPAFETDPLNNQFGTGGNRPLSATMSNTTFELAANNFLGTQPQQVTPAEVLPTNWLGYLVDSLPSGEFEDAVG